MTMFKAILFFTFIALTLQSVNAIAAISFMGTALNPEDRTLLYRELHCAPQDNKPARVIYLTSKNRVVATKDFTKLSHKDKPDFAKPEQLQWLPQYQFTHSDFNTSEAIAFSKGKIVLQRKTPELDQPESKTLVPEKLTSDKPIIADAGFDNFIKSHFDELTKGSAKKVVYLSAPRLSEIDFVIRYEKTKDNLAVFSVYPDNFLIRWLVDPIRVSYDIESKRLMKFEGLTNVPMTPEKNFIADISYQYSDFLNNGPFDEFCN